MTRFTPTEARAELLVRLAYSRGRARGYLDLGGRRRERADDRFERELLHELRLGWREWAALEPTELELEAAFRAVARRRLARETHADDRRGPGVRNALRRAADELFPGRSVEVLAEVGLDRELETRRARDRHGRQVIA